MRWSRRPAVRRFKLLRHQDVLEEGARLRDADVEVPLARVTFDGRLELEIVLAPPGPKTT
jgi:hypothetical protein